MAKNEIHTKKKTNKSQAVITPEILDKICNLAESGSYTIADLCRKNGVKIVTLYAHMKHHPEFRLRLDASRKKFYDNYIPPAEDTKKQEEVVNPRGCPTKLTEALTARICSLIESSNPTDREICRIAELSPSSFILYKKNSNFLERIEAAKEVYYNNMIKYAEDALTKMLKGFDTTERTTIRVNTGAIDKATGKEITKLREERVTEKFVPPSLEAVRFALTNRDGKRWSNRNSTELTGADGKDLNNVISVQVIDSRDKVDEDPD